MNLELFRGRIREFVREPSAGIFVLLVPWVWMIAIKFVVGTGTYPDPIVLGVSEDVQSSLLLGLPSDFSVMTEKDGPHESSQKELVDIYLKKKNDELIYRYDGSSKGLGQVFQLDHWIQNSLGRQDIIPTVRETWGAGASSSWSTEKAVSGILATSLLATSLFGTGMTVVAHRREQILKLFAATPMKPWAYIGSFLSARLVIAFLEYSWILLGAWLLLDFSISPSSAWDGLLWSELGALVITALAMILGSRLTHTGAYSGLANLMFLFLSLGSGAWFPRHHLPHFLRSFLAYLPTSYFIDGFNGIFVHGFSLIHLATPFAALVAYGMGFSFLAYKLFRWF